MQVLVLNGVNLDTLARRDPSVYGGVSLNELETKIYEWAHALDISARCRQTNSEGEYIEWIHDAYDNVDALIVNPGAWSHYSYAIRDALELAEVPIVEVHLSNIEEREDWRRVQRGRRRRLASRDRQRPGRLPRGARVPRREGGRRVSARLTALAARSRRAAARHRPDEHPAT